MYSTARKLSVLCIIVVIFNVLGALLTSLYLSTLPISFGEYLGIMLLIVPTTILTVLISLALRSLVQDLDIEISDRNKKIRDLIDRIASMENKMK